MSGAEQKVARAIDLGRKLRREGVRATTARVALKVHQRLAVPGLQGHILDGDLASLADLDLLPGRVLAPGTNAKIGWLCSPAAPGSGGHTTFFRMLSRMRDEGHQCVVFLYDAYGGDFDRHVAAMRSGWPQLDGVEYRDATEGITGVDASVASSWETAHVLASRGREPMHRFYFIQDFEPFFHPRGPIYSLAADTYRLPLRRISLGGAVAELLKTEIGVDAEVVPFGADTRTYHLQQPQRDRSGVVFFARPDTPRRGYLTGMLALEEFHRRRPEQEIHVFGADVPQQRFPLTSHGRLRPEELNALYNRTIAGLALSFTNVTLVAGEMLAAGNIPVANQSHFARTVLDSDDVVWAEPSPADLARALAGVVECGDIGGRAASAAAAAALTPGWDESSAAVARIIERDLYTE